MTPAKMENNLIGKNIKKEKEMPRLTQVPERINTKKMDNMI